MDRFVHVESLSCCPPRGGKRSGEVGMLLRFGGAIVRACCWRLSRGAAVMSFGLDLAN